MSDKQGRLTFPADPSGCTCPRRRAIGRLSHPSWSSYLCPSSRKAASCSRSRGPRACTYNVYISVRNVSRICHKTAHTVLREMSYVRPAVTHIRGDSPFVNANCNLQIRCKSAAKSARLRTSVYNRSAIETANDRDSSSSSGALGEITVVAEAAATAAVVAATATAAAASPASDVPPNHHSRPGRAIVNPRPFGSRRISRDTSPARRSSYRSKSPQDPRFTFSPSLSRSPTTRLLSPL